MERRQLGDRVRDYYYFLSFFFFLFFFYSFFWGVPSLSLYLLFTLFRSDIRIFGVEVSGTTSIVHDDYPHSQSLSAFCLSEGCKPNGCRLGGAW